MRTGRAIRWTRWGLLVGAVALLVWWMWRPSPIAVEAGVVDRGPVHVTIRDVGTTALPAAVELHAPSGGRWVPSAHRAGESIRSGVPLGTLYPPPLDVAARRAAAATARAADASRDALIDQRAALTALLSEAERDRQRAERLGDGGAISPQMVEQARLAEVTRRGDLAALESRIRGATFDRDAARAVVQRSDSAGLAIRSPRTGTLLQRGFDQEQVVPAGALLATVGDAAMVEIHMPLLTSDALRVRLGDTVRVSLGGTVRRSDDAGPASIVPLTAIVRRIESTAFTKVSALGVEEQRVLVIAELPMVDIPADYRIGADYRAEVQIVVWTRPSVRRIPVSALIRDGERWTAWRIRGGKVEMVDVRIGPIADDAAVVEAGLEEGDSVVVYPTEQVLPGVRVTTRRQRSGRAP